ncbi:bacillithiol biosynthesis cysteine-adding enzyme BshC [Aurantibacter sp.]|uniref:bacillithiol biosynthesis cysteine-adding enzyme BshC n=1 Tax=Aurantibacter sp. TaxID=2807103 RepID=UPI0032639148
MDVDCLNYKQTGFFSKLICDYLEEKETLSGFYNNFPSLKNFEAQIEEKQRSFSDSSRAVLYDSLMAQYADTAISNKTREHIIQLKEPITFTVVTGHQLNLFTGPLYFLYKIISTINLTVELKKEYPQYNFVPIYWMATEDHDFEEINYFNFKGKKLQWNPEGNQGGAVGEIKNEGLQELFEAFSNELGGGKNADFLKNLFRKAYLEHDNLTSATRYLANELFGTYGLVIVDGQDIALKKLLMPYAKKDIIENLAYKRVTESVELLQSASNDYKVQVNPREINYFYLKEGLRERIIAKEDGFGVVDTKINWSKEELLNEMDQFPARFSPNVIARPLYQEVILPNLCYIGGGGEIAYWLELKSMFEVMNVPFPVLLLRNSALIVSEKLKTKTEKLNLQIKDLFLEQNSLINKKIRAISNIDIDFSPQKELLENQFLDMYALAEKTDKSFLGAVKAQEIKQKKGLDNLEKRLMQAQKRKLKDHVLRITELQNQLFPNHSLQERTLNFSELYLEWGEDLIPQLLVALKPLHLEFSILTKN